MRVHNSMHMSAAAAEEFQRLSVLKLGHTPKYGWDFPEEIFRKDPGNALRAFPGIPLESTAGNLPNPYSLRHLTPPEHFLNSLPLSAAGHVSFFRSGREGLSELVVEFPAVLTQFEGIYEKQRRQQVKRA